MIHGLPEKVIDQVRDVLAKYPAVTKAILYGSRAKGNYKNGSDIDLTLEGDVTRRDLFDIEEDIDNLLLPWMFDISIYNHIDNPSLLAHIQRVGTPF